MRTSATFSATSMVILALFLASCGVESGAKVDMQKELAKIKGPEVGTIESTLRAQAEQAANTGNHKRAADIYKQLADKYPERAEYRINLAENLRRSGDPNASLRISEALLTKDPQNAAALESKGLALMNIGEFAEAGDVFGKAMKADPKRWRTLNAVGILFAMKGKYDEAVAYFQAALNVSTDNPSVLNNAALTYAINKQFDRAYDAFGKARRRLDRGSTEIKNLDLNLALVYAVDGKLDEAEQTAAPHLSKQALYNNMGFYSYLSKNNELAKGYLNMALTQSPTYYERAWKNLGALTGDPSAASAGGQVMPMSLNTLPNASPSARELKAPEAPAPQAELSLSDIPESKKLRSDADSPYAGKHEEIEKPVQTSKPKEEKPKDKVAKADAKDIPVPVQVSKQTVYEPVISSPASAAPVAVTPAVSGIEDKPQDNKAQEKAAKEEEKDKSAAVSLTTQTANAATPQLNPDILMHKASDPARNTDWDVKDSGDGVMKKSDLPSTSLSLGSSPEMEK